MTIENEVGEFLKMIMQFLHERIEIQNYMDDNSRTCIDIKMYDVANNKKICYHFCDNKELGIFKSFSIDNKEDDD